MAAGLPQWAAKKAQEPEMETALDELSSLIHDKKSIAQRVGEVAGTVTSSIGLTKGIAKAVAPSLLKNYIALSAPVGGAASGLASSKSGEELEEAAIGGAIGAILPTALMGVGGLVRTGAAKALEYNLTKGRPIQDILEKVLEKRTEERGLVTDLLVGEKKLTDLTEEEIKQVLNKKSLPTNIPEALSPEEYYQQLASSKLDKIKSKISKKEDFSKLLLDKKGREKNNTSA